MLRCFSRDSSNANGNGWDRRGRESKSTVGRSGPPKHGQIGRVGSEVRARPRKYLDVGSDSASPKPSLIEQLFPEETKRHEEVKRAVQREIPRLPMEKVSYVPERRDLYKSPRTFNSKTAKWERGLIRADNQSAEATVLVLRNASPNLTEEDFRRIVPQGKHMEGWTLEQGDILKIVRGRNLATLEHQSYYYLIFGSRLSAFTYQSQATRLSRMAAAHTPTSMASPIRPPPGYLIDGVDAHAAMESFALIPASMNIDLRMLEQPLSPMMQSIVKYQGYFSLVSRPDKMPYETRFTLDGPQLQPNAIRHILHKSGRGRALSWSGGDDVLPKITKWEPQAHVNPHEYDSALALKVASANARTEEEQMQHDFDKLQTSEGRRPGQERRTPQQLVYIMGFKTECAARSFIAFWHRRPMREEKGYGGGKDEEADLPPVANVEMLF
ncbi:hypothetical protein B0A50_01213 [Salinomyces thailandicus]|uniref:Uncharacterized protein n=1 Tax=Salinomyces thailandicus TaxID=706561 RepID=A0A4U0U9Q3_9PEZI|nr:hypothetical protein B0A50_01213 [Salinomyces thailandica]